MPIQRQDLNPLGVLLSNLPHQRKNQYRAQSDQTKDHVRCMQTNQ